MTDLETLAQSRVACPRCEQAPGQACVTKTGKPSGRNHSARAATLYDVWRIGYREGRADEKHRGSGDG